MQQVTCIDGITIRRVGRPCKTAVGVHGSTERAATAAMSLPSGPDDNRTCFSNPIPVLHPQARSASNAGGIGEWKWVSKDQVRYKKTRYFCQHDKRRDGCKACGGAGICEHDHHRRFCTRCRGASLCDHLRQKSKCVYCKGIKQRVEDERQKQLDCVGVRVAVRSILPAVE